MFNTQRILDVMSFNLPQDIVLQGNKISQGRITIMRENKNYQFIRYEENSSGLFNAKNYGFIPVSEGSAFFQKIFNVDLIDEADANL